MASVSCPIPDQVGDKLDEPASKALLNDLIIGDTRMKGKPVVPPVYQTATYYFNTSDDMIDVVQNRSGYIYSRWDNPSVRHVEDKLAELEAYDHALGFSSGMAAITTAIMSHVKTGDRIVSIRESYGGTFELLNKLLPGYGVQTVFVNCWDLEGLFKEIDQGLSLLYLETPTNPLLRVMDVKSLTEAAHAKGALVLLDSTFATPVNQHPADWDVDIVIHSATKYLGGHHDITAGFACCHETCFEKIWDCRKILGGVMDPLTAFLIVRGLRTLALRVRQHNINAMRVAEFLEGAEKIRRVYYPGLPSHPDHDIARKQMQGFGGMLSFELDAGFDRTKQFMDQLQCIKRATSLGGVTSLANQPVTNTHVALNPAERKKAGVMESLVRLSVGIEDTSVLIEDLKQALSKI
jgi:cystathionine gamma-synthase